MQKGLKCLLVALMLFSQLASPTLVIADVLEDSALGASEEITKIATYEFEITNEKNDTTFSVHLKDIATNSAISDDSKYLIKSILSFNEINATIVDAASSILFVTGSELKNTTITFDNIGANLNGTYDFNANIYLLDDTITAESTQEDINNFIASNTAVKNIEKLGIDKNEIISLKLKAVNDELSFDTITKEYILSKDAINKIVNLSYDFLKATTDIKTTIKNLEYTINDTLSLNDYNFDEKLDFSLMLYGTYKITLKITDTENNTYTDEIIIKYEGLNENLDSYFDINDEASEEEVFAKLVSTTVLSEEELTQLEVDEEELKDLVIKTPVDNTISSKLTLGIGQNVIADSFAENGSCIISDAFIGKLKDEDPLLTIKEIYNYLADTGYQISVVDKYGNEVAEDRFIETGMQLKVKLLSQELSYTFIVLGDYDGGLVEGSEVNALIDKVLGITSIDGIYKSALDVNKDSFIDILDISKIAGSIFKQNWSSISSNGDKITSSLVRNTNDLIRVGDTFKVSFSLNGFDKDYINAIEGVLNYDKTALSLVGISTTDALSQYGNINYSTSHFIKAGEQIVNTDTVIMTFTFKALKETSTTISIDRLHGGMDGVFVDINSNNALVININRALSTNNDIIELKPSTGTLDKEFNKDVYEYNLYVDASTSSITLQGLLGDKYAATMGFKEYKLTGDTTVIYLDVTSETGDVKTYKINVIKVYPKSSNNYLNKLEIKGYEIDFDKDVLEYEITVASDVDSLDITAIADASTSNVRIYGNDSFEEGENIVTIVVTAEDGSQKTYTIKVNKEKEEKKVTKTTEDDDDAEENSNSNTEKTVIIILIILVVAGLLYLIFKKDEEVDNTTKSTK